MTALRDTSMPAPDEASTRTSTVTASAVTGSPTVPHSIAEDVLGILTGTLVASFGLFLLKSATAVTGGTAGLGLLVTYASGLPFGVVFFLVNVPFFALALWKKGWNFTLRTLVSVALVAAFSSIYPHAVAFEHLDPVLAVLLGNVLAGVGILILFRHKGSLGGLNILVLLLQERFGWRAGYVQMALDVSIVLAALTVVPPLTALLSAVGAVALNLVLAFNHRPGRYLGA